MKKFLVLGLCVSLVGCTTPSTEVSDQLKVTTTIYPITYFTELIGGDHVEVTQLLENGGDPHSYEPTIAQLTDASTSDFFFYIDEENETFVPKLLPNLETEGVTSVALNDYLNIDDHSHDEGTNIDSGDDLHDDNHAIDHDEDDTASDEGTNIDSGDDLHDDNHAIDHDDHHEDDTASDEGTDIDAGDDLHHDHDHDDEADTSHDHDHDHETDTSHEHDHDHDHSNTHSWLHPLYAKQLAHTIMTKLSDATPEHAKTFEANYEQLAKQFDDLDAAFHELGHLNDDTFVVTHAAYGLWEDYGIQQLPITGILGNDEPTQQELITLIETAKEKNINYLYYEQNIPSSYGDLIKGELSLTPLALHNVSSLTNEDVKNGEDYFTLMYKNIENLKSELTD